MVLNRVFLQVKTGNVASVLCNVASTQIIGGKTAKSKNLGEDTYFHLFNSPWDVTYWNMKEFALAD